jgi:glyoxylase-like metal-dependent hydrolase (beta-lactamase superfamily II)
MTEVIRGVHDIDLGMVHAYLYAERDRLTLIDTGLDSHARRILDEIEAIGRKPSDLRQIFVTHYHADHTGSLAELVERTGARVLVHTLDAPVVRGDVSEPEPVYITDQEREFGERIRADVTPPRHCPVDRELSDDDEIEVGDGASVVHVPGHTAGSMALYVPKHRLLFSGDAAVRGPDSRLMSGVFNVDTAQARASFAKLTELDFDVACFGHGTPLDKDASHEFRRLAEKLAR